MWHNKTQMLFQHTKNNGGNVSSLLLGICISNSTATCVYHLSPPSPSVWLRVLQRHFLCSLSVAHSSLMCQASMSLLTVFFHLNFGLLLGRSLSIFISTTVRMFSCFISSLEVPEPTLPSPSHNHRYRFQLCLFQDLLIYSVF